MSNPGFTRSIADQDVRTVRLGNLTQPGMPSAGLRSTSPRTPSPPRAVAQDRATEVEIIEYAADGREIQRTYGT